MTAESTARTPREQRAYLRAQLARVIRRSLDRHDVTQAQLADLCGVAASKVGRWVDHTSNEVPGASDIALMPTAVASDLLTWIAGRLRLTVAEDISCESPQDHLLRLHQIVREGGDVTATYSRIVATGRAPTPADRRDLIRELGESIAAQTALLRDLEGEEAAHAHDVQRRPTSRLRGVS